MSSVLGEADEARGREEDADDLLLGFLVVVDLVAADEWCVGVNWNVGVFHAPLLELAYAD